MAHKDVTGAVKAQDLGLTQTNIRQSPANFALAVRVLLQNWRQGTVACKGRSDVNKSGRKPFKQKGTGRARAGTARSPLWRGGGVTFGPQPRTQTLKVNKKVRRSVLGELAWQRLDAGSVVALPLSRSSAEIKTATIAKVLAAAGLQDRPVALFLSVQDYALQASCANIPHVQVLLFDQPNVFELARNTFWAFLEEDKPAFVEMVRAWN